MKIVIKVLRGILTVFLFLIVAVNLWMAAQKAFFHKDPPQLLGYSQLVVTSGSMEPAFSAGDVILIHEESSYQPGQVVTFRDLQGELVTHRIVGTVEEKFITQGDANNTQDEELLTPDRIVGALVTYIPGVGSALLFFRTPLGIIVLALLGLLLIELPNWVGAFRKKGKGRHADDGI